MESSLSSDISSENNFCTFQDQAISYSYSRLFPSTLEYLVSDVVILLLSSPRH